MINAIKQGWATAFWTTATTGQNGPSDGGSGDHYQARPRSPKDASKGGREGALAALREPAALRCEVHKLTDAELCEAYALEQKEELEHALDEAMKKPSTHPPRKIVNTTKHVLASMQARFDAGCFEIDEAQPDRVATMLHGENDFGADGEGPVTYWFTLQAGERRTRASLPNPDVAMKQHVKVQVSVDLDFYVTGDSIVTKRHGECLGAWKPKAEGRGKQQREVQDASRSAHRPLPGA